MFLMCVLLMEAYNIDYMLQLQEWMDTLSLYMLCVSETVQPYSLAQMKIYSVAVTAGVSSTEMFPTHRLQTAVECNEGLDSIPTGFQMSTFDLYVKKTW